MTSKEALEYLEDIYEHEEGELRPYDDPIGKKIDYQEEFDILRKLVDRDTPKKVVREVDKKYVDAKEFYERDIYRCGSCNNVLIVDRYQRLEDKDKIKYCSECGQRLDWRKEK